MAFRPEERRYQLVGRVWNAAMANAPALELDSAHRHRLEHARGVQMPPIPEVWPIAELGLSLRFETVPVAGSTAVFNNADKLVAYIASDRALGPVTVRPWQP